MARGGEENRETKSHGKEKANGGKKGEERKERKTIENEEGKRERGRNLAVVQGGSRTLNDGTV